MQQVMVHVIFMARRLAALRKEIKSKTRDETKEGDPKAAQSLWRR